MKEKATVVKQLYRLSVEPRVVDQLAKLATRQAPASMNLRSDLARLNGVSPSGMKLSSDSPRTRR